MTLTIVAELIPCAFLTLVIFTFLNTAFAIEIKINPESPTQNDEVSVVVEFTKGGSFVGTKGFSIEGNTVNVWMYQDGGTFSPPIGFFIESQIIGKLSPGQYMFKVQVTDENTEPEILLVTVRETQIISTRPNTVAPKYQSRILTIPRVDIPEQAGFYQNATFKLTEQGLWELLDFRIGTKIQKIDEVKAIIVDTFPTQVFLKVSGEFSNGCGSLGQISYRLNLNKFEVILYHKFDDALSSEETACTAAIIPFETIIPLSVYGLEAGVYEYNVNGSSGTFSLMKDNAL